MSAESANCPTGEPASRLRTRASEPASRPVSRGSFMAGVEGMNNGHAAKSPQLVLPLIMPRTGGSKAHADAAVDGHDRAGDELGRRGRQVDRRPAHIGRFAQAL